MEDKNITLKTETVDEKGMSKAILKLLNDMELKETLKRKGI